MSSSDLRLRETIPGSRYHKCLNLIRRIEISRPTIWEEVTILLSNHLGEQGYQGSVEGMVAIAREALVYNSQDLIKSYGLSQTTFFRQLDEVIAAIYFIIDDVKIFPPRLLGSEATKQLEQLRQSIEKIANVRKVSSYPDIQNVLAKFKPLGALVDTLAYNGKITDALSSLGLEYENPRNVDSSFHRFTTKGVSNGGIPTLLRRFLYAQWLASDSWDINSEEKPLIQLFQWAGATILTTDVGGRAIRNTRAFLHYLIISDFVHYIESPHITKADLEYVFPTVVGEAECLRVNPSNFSPGGLKRARESYVEQGGDILLPLDCREYINRLNITFFSVRLRDYVAEVVHLRDRQLLVQKIADLLGRSPEGARKVYDASLYFIDYLLTSPVAFKDVYKLKRVLSSSPVISAYEEYKAAILARHES